MTPLSLRHKSLRRGKNWPSRQVQRVPFFASFDAWRKLLHEQGLEESEFRGVTRFRNRETGACYLSSDPHPCTNAYSRYDSFCRHVAVQECLADPVGGKVCHSTIRIINA